MRKEIIIATIAGIIIGILVAFGSWRANLALKVKDKTSNALVTQVSSNPKNKTQNSQKNENLAITLTNVDDFDVLTESKINIVGITKPNSILAISGETEDYIVKSGNDGSFEQEIDLNSGLNQVLFSAFSPQGESVEKKLVIVYSMEFGNSGN